MTGLLFPYHISINMRYQRKGEHIQCVEKIYFPEGLIIKQLFIDDCDYVIEVWWRSTSSSKRNRHKHICYLLKGHVLARF